MKIKAVISSAAAVLLVAGIAYAQGHAAHHPQQAQMKGDTSQARGMMQGGMMGKMMQGGMMGGMMQGGMMGGMMKGMGMMQGGMGMSDPLHRYIRVLHHLPALSARLNLTESQQAQFKQIRADFLKKQADWKASLEKTKIDLNLLLDQNASAKEIKKLLEKFYQTQIEMQITAYRTVRQLKGLLNPDQQKQWASLTGKTCSGGMGKGMMGKGMGGPSKK